MKRISALNKIRQPYSQKKEIKYQPQQISKIEENRNRQNEQQ